MTTTTRVAWIAGASGLVGGYALDALLADPDFSAVISFGRRPSGRAHERLVERTADFASLRASELGDVAAPDVALCALGTTIKKAGSKEAFRAVDHDAVLAFARAAKERGAKTFVVVTALGADKGSMAFYNRVKGEVEEALRAMEWPSLVIAQPSLLLGDRAESRPGERVAIVLSRALRPLLSPFGGRPIEARDVGESIVRLAKQAPAGTRVVPSGELHRGATP
jgi:uncharacterized protein YbjT (DUF2867 family)